MQERERACDEEGLRLIALQEQAGLRLESTRGDVRVMVIDSVERPPEN